jgi:hypothetical protein
MRLRRQMGTLAFVTLGGLTILGGCADFGTMSERQMTLAHPRPGIVTTNPTQGGSNSGAGAGSIAVQWSGDAQTPAMFAGPQRGPTVATSHPTGTGTGG